MPLTNTSASLLRQALTGGDLQTRTQPIGQITSGDVANEPNIADVINRKSTKFNRGPVGADLPTEAILARMPGDPRADRRDQPPPKDENDTPILKAAWFKRALFDPNVPDISPRAPSLQPNVGAFPHNEAALRKEIIDKTDTLNMGPQTKGPVSDTRSLYQSSTAETFRPSIRGTTANTDLHRRLGITEPTEQAIQAGTAGQRIETPEIARTWLHDRDLKVAAPIPMVPGMLTDREWNNPYEDDLDQKARINKPAGTHPGGRAQGGGSFGDSYRRPGNSFLANFLTRRYRRD